MVKLNSKEDGEDLRVGTANKEAAEELVAGSATAREEAAEADTDSRVEAAADR